MKVNELNWFKEKVLLLPFLIFIIAFGLDKFLSLEGVHTYFSKTLSDINYIQKEELYQDLQKYLQTPQRKKVLVYFGNSRALLFNKDYIETKYPEWTLFNFSVPGGRPDYALQWAERFAQDGTRPDFVLFDHSTELYNSQASLKVDETLTNGLKVGFVLRHWKYFTTSEISTLLAKRMFYAYLYRPKLEVILARAKARETYLYPYQNLRMGFVSQLKLGQGSAITPGTHEGIMPEGLLKKSSFGDFNSYLVPFVFDDRMLYFFQGSVSEFRKIGVPMASIWVRLSLPYFELFKSQKVANEKRETVYENWLPKIEDFQRKNQLPFWNMNDDKNYNCNAFSDAGHMSPACYVDYTNYIMKRVTEK